jgi:hypothetical protein
VVLLDIKSAIAREVSTCPLGPKAVFFRLEKIYSEALIVAMPVFAELAN